MLAVCVLGVELVCRGHVVAVLTAVPIVAGVGGDDHIVISKLGTHIIHADDHDIDQHEAEQQAHGKPLDFGGDFICLLFQQLPLLQFLLFYAIIYMVEDNLFAEPIDSRKCGRHKCFFFLFSNILALYSFQAVICMIANGSAKKALYGHKACSCLPPHFCALMIR